MIEIRECSGAHLTLEDRMYIQTALERQLTFKEMAKFLKKDPTTISKEIRKRRIEKPLGSVEYGSHCAMEFTCKVTGVCASQYCSEDSRCAVCKICNCSMYCDKYIPATCEKLKRPPYVCNGCYKVRRCSYDKMFYRAKYADDMYHELLAESRRGINQTPEELHQLDELVSPLVKNGQSLAHIFAKHEEDIPCCRRTLYNYFERNLLTAKNIDLPRKVRYKKRKSPEERTKDKQYRIGRTYEDYQRYLGEHPEVNPVQMDLVEGKIGGSVLMTILFCNCTMMLIYHLKNKSQKHVKAVFDRLENALGAELFCKLFPVILTDNGSEFQDPSVIEINADGQKRTKVFYCDANSSWQKGQIEKNHEFIRYIIAKGQSFDKLTDRQVEAMRDHINSFSRDGLNGACPYNIAPLLLHKDIMKKLGLHHIPHDEVLLKPELIKH